MSRKTSNKMVIIAVVFIITLVIVSWSDVLIAKPIIALSELIPSESPMHQRVNDIGKLLLGESGNNNLMLDRLERYADSVRGFSKKPIFRNGIQNILGIAQGENKAGHNSLAEFLNIYGLFFGLPVYIFVGRMYRKILRAWKKTDISYYNLLSALLIAYIMLACLNPVFNLFATSWVVCHIVSFVPLIGANKEKLDRFAFELSNAK